MRIDVTMHIASEADLDALVRLAVAFRDHVGQSTPSAEEFCSSIALLLHEANTEFFLASTPTGAASDMCSVATATQSRRLALEAEIETGMLPRRSGHWARLTASALKTMPSSVAAPSAIRPEKPDGAGTAGAHRPAAPAPPGLYPGGATVQCMTPAATPLYRSSHGAGCSQWRQCVAAPRPDTRSTIPLADHSSRIAQAGTPCRRAASVRAGWLRLHLHRTRTQNLYCSGVPSATVA